jgi:hypothetical protein
MMGLNVFVPEFPVSLFKIKAAGLANIAMDLLGGFGQARVPLD